MSSQEKCAAAGAFLDYFLHSTHFQGVRRKYRSHFVLEMNEILSSVRISQSIVALYRSLLERAGKFVKVMFRIDALLAAPI